MEPGTDAAKAAAADTGGRAARERLDAAPPAPAPDLPPEPPPGVPALAFVDDTIEVSGFVAAQAARHGVIGNRAALLVIAAGDVAAHLRDTGAPGATVRVWFQPEPTPPSLVCSFQAPAGWEGAPSPTPGLGNRVELSTSGPITTLRLPL